MTMREKMLDAMEAAYRQPWDETIGKGSPLERVLDAALQAISEPSEEMVEAGDASNIQLDCGQSAGVFTAMIQAVKEGK